MKVLYIGQYTDGTTSKMRADIISEYLNAESFDVIDTHVPFFLTNKWFRSLGFRFKIGPLIRNINSYIITEFITKEYDLVWVDKGIFISESTLGKIRGYTKKLIYFTPDMSFYENKSKHFEKSISLYDFVITTKTKEEQFFLERISKDKLIITTQGYSPKVHKANHSFEEKISAICFIGLAEPNRIKIAEKLLALNMNLKIVGKGWRKFVEKHKENPNLEFIGDSIYGDDYARLISSCRYALGFLSKRFPELHTTRTFEIPACKTALVTEYNQEIASFFDADEVIYFEKPEEIVSKINYYDTHVDNLDQLINKSIKKITDIGLDYHSIIGRLLDQVLK